MQKKCEKMQKNFAMSKNCCTFAAAFEKRHYFFVVDRIESIASIRR